MHTQRTPRPELQPFQIRLRQVFSGNGETRVTESRSRPARARSMWVEGSAVVADSTPVSELMTTHVLCVRSDVSLEALRALLLERGISGVPVVDEYGAPIGIVSKTDLVRHRFEDGETGAVEPRFGSGFHTSELVEGTVADVMSTLPISVFEDTPICRVAAAMASEGVHRVPVVGADGTVVGIVSSLDIVSWYAQREGSL